MSVIQRIKELREKATQGEWEFEQVEKEGSTDIDYGIRSLEEDRLTMLSGIEDMALSPNDAEYIVALHNAFPSIIQEHEALLRFVETVRAWDDCSFPTIQSALQALDKELKG